MEKQKVIEKFIQLRATGQTFPSLSKELDTPVSDLIEWSHEHQQRIRNLQAIFYEESNSKTFVGSNSRIPLLQSLAEKVRDELSKRDFADMPTEKLLAILPKLTDALKSDEKELVLTKTISSSSFDLSHLLDTKETVSWKV